MRMYCINSDTNYDLINLNIQENEIIVGDFNAHDVIWDDFARPNSRGNNLCDNMIEHNILALNDSTIHTRVDISNGNKSSPDISLVHESNTSCVNWNVIDRGTSDHRPIIIELKAETEQQDEEGRLVWKWKKANWEKFKKDVDKHLGLYRTDKTIKFNEHWLRKTILKSASKNIDTMKVTKKHQCWITNDIHDTIQLRDELKKTRWENEDAYKTTEELVKNKIKEEKQRIWRDKVTSTNNSKDMWNTIKCLQGNDRQSNDQVLETENGVHRTNRSKANAFRVAYQNVSKLKKTKEDRWVKRGLHKLLKTPTCDGPSTMEINTEEITRAINNMNPNKSPGPDKIHPKFIINLGKKAINFIHTLFNTIWDTGSVPQIWRTADIRTILKKGKDATKTSSYRPISLTSCMGKIMERIICNRLTFILENNNLLNKNQCGFRSRRCTEDQLITLTQTISDGLHKRPMERTLLTLLDYSKAYDKVWKEGLLYKMAKLNLPRKFLKWTMGWLSNRQAFVTYNGTQSKKTTFREGVPQGSVISPLLFSLFINDITDDINDNTKVSLFADDVAIYVTHRNKQHITTNMQDSINNISKWSKKWKMTLSPEKCETSVFSNNNQDNTWNPNIIINNNALKINKYPKFLGVTFDQRLTFSAHVDNVAKKIKQRTNILRQLAGSDWGYDKQLLRSTYIATGRSCIEYAAAGWAPWISKTNLEKLETAQRYAGRAITGLTKTAPCDSILIESDLPSVKTRLPPEQLDSL